MKLILFACLVGLALSTPIENLEVGEADLCPDDLDDNTTQEPDILTAPGSDETIAPITTQIPTLAPTTEPISEEPATEAATEAPIVEPGTPIIVMVIDIRANSDAEGIIAGASISGDLSGTTDSSGQVELSTSAASVSLQGSAAGYVTSAEAQYDTVDGIIKIYLVDESAGSGYLVTLTWGPGEVDDMDIHAFCRSGAEGSGEFEHVYYSRTSVQQGELSITLDRDDEIEDEADLDAMETMTFQGIGVDDFCSVAIYAYDGTNNVYGNEHNTANLYYAGQLVDTKSFPASSAPEGATIGIIGIWNIVPGLEARFVDIEGEYEADYASGIDNEWIDGVEEENENPYAKADPLWVEYQNDPLQGEVVYDAPGRQ
jgi:hypothetical protein